MTRNNSPDSASLQLSRGRAACEAHGGVRVASVIFRQDTPCNEQGQGMNGGPKRGADQTDNHGIAYRQ